MINVSLHPQSEVVKIPLNGEGTIGKKTLQSQFPAAIGLKYYKDDGWIAVQMDNDNFCIPTHTLQIDKFIVVTGNMGKLCTNTNIWHHPIDLQVTILANFKIKDTLYHIFFLSIRIHILKHGSGLHTCTKHSDSNQLLVKLCLLHSHTGLQITTRPLANATKFWLWTTKNSELLAHLRSRIHYVWINYSMCCGFIDVHMGL